MSGTGHTYYRRAPVSDRPRFAWPNGSQAACAIVVSAEYYEMQPPPDAFIPANLPGGFGRGPYPDFRNYSARAYGNRVGIFRILEALDRSGLPAAVAVDQLTTTLCPQLLPHLLRRKLEIIAHGQAVNRVMSSRMSEQEEREYIAATLAAVHTATGTTPKGWHGPEYGESARTPELLAQAGLGYMLDWPNDEQPVMMATAQGALVSLPMLIDLDDVFAQMTRRLSPSQWRRAAENAVDQHVRDGEEDGLARLLVLNLHPWLSGHPFRIDEVEALFATLASRRNIWLATPGEIATFWTTQHHSQ
jgi:peptidoglycan/xylan/chitin deacetylase (PgdA/CDA1 family)